MSVKNPYEVDSIYKQKSPLGMFGTKDPNRLDNYAREIEKRMAEYKGDLKERFDIVPDGPRYDMDNYHAMEQMMSGGKFTPPDTSKFQKGDIDYTEDGVALEKELADPNATNESETSGMFSGFSDLSDNQKLSMVKSLGGAVDDILKRQQYGEVAAVDAAAAPFSGQRVSGTLKGGPLGATPMKDILEGELIGMQKDERDRIENMKANAGDYIDALRRELNVYRDNLKKGR